MDSIESLKELDPWVIFSVILSAILAGQFLYKIVVEGIFQKYGWETKKMRQHREDHEKFNTVVELVNKTAENLDKLQKRHSNDEEDFRNSLNNYMEESRKDRKAIHDEMTKFTSNRVSDRQQSIQIQKELSDAQVSISNRVKDISDKLDKMQKHTDERFVASEEKENKRVQSEIKERIAQVYRGYNSTKKISAMELEALEDLIETYELHGGKNSFVHSVVQKEMYTWETT